MFPVEDRQKSSLMRLRPLNSLKFNQLSKEREGRDKESQDNPESLENLPGKAGITSRLREHPDMKREDTMRQDTREQPRGIQEITTEDTMKDTEEHWRGKTKNQEGDTKSQEVDMSSQGLDTNNQEADTRKSQGGGQPNTNYDSVKIQYS